MGIYFITIPMNNLLYKNLFFCLFLLNLVLFIIEMNFIDHYWLNNISNLHYNTIIFFLLFIIQYRWTKLFRNIWFKDIFLILMIILWTFQVFVYKDENIIIQNLHNASWNWIIFVITYSILENKNILNSNNLLWIDLSFLLKSIVWFSIWFILNLTFPYLALENISKLINYILI